MSRLRSGLIMAGMLMVLATHAIGAEPTPKVTVWLYNPAKVPADTLEEAKEVATWVLTQAGVEVEWQESGPGARAFRSSVLVLRLVPEAVNSTWGIDASHLAFSIVPRNGGSYFAAVITDRVEETAGREGYPLALVLGHVMAHELGHLLLGDKEHSRAGIMSFPVDHRFLASAYRRHLRFTPSQQKRLRREVRRRSEVR